MKKLTALLLILLLLAGCGLQKTKTKPEKTVDSVIEKDDPKQETPDPEPVLETDLLSDAKPFEGSVNLYAVPNEAVSGLSFPELYELGGNFLLTHTTGTCEYGGAVLQLLEPEHGAVIAEYTVDDMYCPRVTVLGDRVQLGDAASGRVMVLDEGLNVLDTVTFDNYDASEAFLSPDLSTLYVLHYEGGISCLNRETGESSVLLDYASGLFLQEVDGEELIISYTDTNTTLYAYAALNLNTGECLNDPFGRDYGQVIRTGDVWIAGLSGHSGTYFIGSSADCMVLETEYTNVHRAEGIGDFILLRSTYSDASPDSLNEYLLMNTDGTCEACASSVTTSGSLSNEWLWSERYAGYFSIYSSYDSASSVLVFWDTSVPAADKDMPLYPISDYMPEEGSGDLVAKELYERAEAMSEQYGITVNIADRCREVYTDYQPEVCADYWSISAGLDQLESVLAAFPEGFFAQMYHDNYRALEINLTGTIVVPEVPEDATGFTSYQGFLEYGEDAFIMAMDVTTDTDLTGSFYHEIFHMLDTKLEAVSYLRDTIYSLEGWESLNPEDGGYAYSYLYVPEEYYEQDLFDYYIDVYSRTFPTEDRARVFEYACTWPEFFEGKEGLLVKLQYLSDSIRDALDTEGWPEVLPWEKPLELYGYLDGARG